MKILFMGTPDFAAEALRALIESPEHTVTAVVTQPDKPKGRGYTLTPPPVKVTAQENGIPCYQPTTLKDGAFAQTLAALDPEIIVVAAYGKILPAYILDYPKYGCINIHGSLLPRYRGAAPIQRAIIDGERVTGITIMKMEQGLDTGDMYAKTEVEITPHDTFETVHDKLALTGAKLLLATLPQIEAGTALPQKQDDALATYAQKIEKADCVLHFENSAHSLCCQIRGLSPFPLAVCRHRGKLLKIANAHPAAGSGKPGQVLSLKDEIVIACGDGAIAVTEVLPEGKRRMSAQEFIRGRGVETGEVLEVLTV